MLEDWASPTWMLFHTLAEKIKYEYYNETKEELIELIISISCNLPCPQCSSHSKEYFKKIKKNKNIADKKEDLIKLLYDFHNNVNIRLNKPVFNFENIHTYKNSNTIQVVNTFINRYTISNNRSHLFHRALTAKHIIMNMINWFNKNIYKFDL